MNIRQTCFHCNNPFKEAKDILAYEDGESFPTDHIHYNGEWEGIWFRFVCIHCVSKEMEFYQNSNKYKQLVENYKKFMNEVVM